MIHQISRFMDAILGFVSQSMISPAHLCGFSSDLLQSNVCCISLFRKQQILENVLITHLRDRGRCTETILCVNKQRETERRAEIGQN